MAVGFAMFLPATPAYVWRAPYQKIFEENQKKNKN